MNSKDFMTIREEKHHQIKKQFNKMVILTFGSFMGIICDLAMGPPGFFGASKDSYVFTVCGLLLAGIA